ncbi:hypothetical protein EI427_09855 [Flammeovirga pectinis]|uniref:Uncharacterized protein n=1 Tax=Flammeovirga pectinis TaxID=2494373 RepID=A0A3S9P2X0_9BACT|nr:hypothetical protein [Flammeovirga pectinis]AZQ62535.1 hypothetical protein EI427_09855 [Flammeovirga pectinis]
MHIQIVCIASDPVNPEVDQELGYLIADAIQVSLKEMRATSITMEVTSGIEANPTADAVIWLLGGDLDLKDVSLNEGQKNYKLLVDSLGYHNQPQSLQPLKSYYLSKYETRIGKQVTLTIPLDEGYRVYFWLVISDLALDIFDEKNNRDYKANVFLGEVTDDLRMERLLLKRDLKAYGFQIYPKRDYSYDTDELTRLQWKDLDNSCIAIHLAGGREGVDIGHESYSFQEWQEKVSETYVKQNNNRIKKFVWVPPAIRFFSDKRKFYIEKLLKNIDEHEQTYTFKTDLERFKTILHNELRAGDKGDDYEEIDEFYKKKVYIMSDVADTESATGLGQRLSTMGFGVLSLGTGQGAKMMRRQHQRHLQICNSTIVFVDKAPEEWIIAKLQDNLRASGLGRKEPLNIKAVVTANYSTATRLTKLLDENPLYHSVGVFTNDDVMISDDLLSFLSSLSE